MPPLNEKTYGDVKKVIELANKKGRDPIQELDRAMLIRSPEHTKAEKIATLSDLWHRLDAQRPADIMQVFMGRHDGTPEDMYRALLDWLEAVINSVEKGEDQ